jgi:hypothetical protein
MIRHRFLLKPQTAIDPFRSTASAARLPPQIPMTSSDQTPPIIGSTSKHCIPRLLTRITCPQRRTIARRAFDLSHHRFTQNHKSP